VVAKAWIVRLLATAVLLPAAIVVLSAFGRLLRAMGDAAAGLFLDRVALTGGVIWILVLLGLLLAVAARQTNGEPDELDGDR
jgi:hypothetical protein